MDIQNIFEVVKEILINSLEVKVSSESISMNMSLQDLGLNSISMIKMIVQLEERFGFEFEDEFLSFEKLNSIKSVVEYVQLRNDML